MKLYEKLLNIPPGHQISYKELSEVIGRDVQIGARGALTTARRRALSSDGAVFDAVHNVGLRRADDEALVDGSVKGLDRVRRGVRREIKRLTCVRNFDSLPNEKKVEHNTRLSVFGLLEHVTKPARVKQLAKSVEEAQTSLSLARTLEAFKA